MNAPVKPHHDTFSRFQKEQSGKDLAGFVAYALYKKDKISWIESREKATGVRPSPEEIEAYFIRTLTEAQIQVYRERAGEMLNQFADAMLGAELEVAREAIKSDATLSAIRSEVASIKTEVKNANGFWGGVWQNLMANGIAWLIGVIAIMGAWAYYDVGKLVEYYKHSQEQNLPPSGG